MAEISRSHRFYKNFYNPTPWFKVEPRDFCYYLALGFIRKARNAHPRSWHKDIRAANGILLLLFCWNFAARKTKKLTVNKVQDLLRRNIKALNHLECYSLKDIEGIDQRLITTVFSSFRATLGQTGATKALSLINPRLFVMWDTAIRKGTYKTRYNGRHRERQEGFPIHNFPEVSTRLF